jgi:hypothetical protein
MEDMAGSSFRIGFAVAVGEVRRGFEERNRTGLLSKKLG